MAIVLYRGKRYSCKAEARHQQGGEFLPCQDCVPVKQWMGAPPVHCDLCNRALKDVFIDGRTIMGMWAIMCWMCHVRKGCGLGLGKGQKYDLTTLEKIE